MQTNGFITVPFHLEKPNSTPHAVDVLRYSRFRGWHFESVKLQGNESDLNNLLSEYEKALGAIVKQFNTAMQKRHKIPHMIAYSGTLLLDTLLLVNAALHGSRRYYFTNDVSDSNTPQSTNTTSTYPDWLISTNALIRFDLASNILLAILPNLFTFGVFLANNLMATPQELAIIYNRGRREYNRLCHFRHPTDDIVLEPEHHAGPMP